MMGQEHETKRDGRLSGLSNALRRRRSDSFEVAEYHIGDIRSDSSVVVAQGATLVGDLLAPEVVVAGIVYGYVACRRLTVGPSGQVWGDIYTNSLELAPSGKVNGWICTRDAGTVDVFRAGTDKAAIPPDNNKAGCPSVPPPGSRP